MATDHETRPGRILLIEGLPDPDPFDPEAALREFVRLSGARGGRIVILPATTPDQLGNGRRYAHFLTALGAGMVTVLHIERRAHAEDENACGVFQDASGILLTGNDRARLTQLLGGTAAIRAIQQRNQDGCVVAVTKAGAPFLPAFTVPMPGTLLADTAAVEC